MSEPHTELEPQHGLHMLFLLVLVFFLMGLVGFMICHVLKKKGYRCRASRDPEPTAQAPSAEDDDMDQDTVERIVLCIIQNEANAEALKEMLGDSEGEGTLPLSSLDTQPTDQDGSPGGPSHHHTVHLGSSAPCIHCRLPKRPPLVRQGRSKEGKTRVRPGETTVFSVGRFRVTHIEKRSGLQEQRNEFLHGSRTLSIGQDSGGGQGTPPHPTPPPERPQAGAEGKELQNGGLKGSGTLPPPPTEGSPRAAEKTDLAIAEKEGLRPELTSRETSGQPAGLEPTKHQTQPGGGGSAGV
ncbi:RELT-like protein 2 [Tachyglossus aculeatus]|uniref:RELT-like protein 2 n=1 Tax=Tachyglossus aculeatus TaxID=9261 RepID=UPI0018F6CCF6|nr:RELT-like protein 2 [Tachyglossus aculeatus]XP_038627458.1 RELT-like protein 2 [Tachyglossus aculeatus]